MAEEKVVERCPRCGEPHERGPYVRWPDGSYGPEDVRCKCGLTLEWVVPVFKVTESGYRLVPKREK